MSNNILNTFYQETNELLLSLEDSLLIMEQDPDEKNAMDSAFRSIHTIKGSSGTFGFEHIEQFAHHVEHLLDCIRHQEIGLTESVIALLLACKDHLEQLVKTVALGNGENASLGAKSEELITTLQAHIPSSEEKAHVNANKSIAATPVTTGSTNNNSRSGSPNWHISIRFADNILHRGMDPISILQYLSKLGKIEKTITLWHKLPALKDINPLTCYPALEIEFNSDASKHEIESAFQFIKDDCTICIVPPCSDLSFYAALYEILPESSAEIENVLLECGTLSQQQIDELQSVTPVEHSNILMGNTDERQTPLTLDTSHMETTTSIDTVALDVQQTNDVRIDDTDKLDSLINLVGELVISGATTRLLAQQVGNEDLLESISRMGRLIEEIRDSVLNRRMVQIGVLFQLFNVLAEEVNQESGKSVQLEISGSETELEKSIIEKLSEPLTRLVKSILDCIGNEQNRVLSDKNPTGKFQVNAYHDSGSIVIEFLDDGRGLPLEELTRYAINNNLIEPDHQYSSNEIYRVILDSAISTGELESAITNHILTVQQVRRSIEALRGTLYVESIEPDSTLINIRLPLTLAIIDGFLVGVGKSSYIIPLDMVVECVELEDVEQHVDKTKSYINLRGEVLPFIRLRELFNETRGTNTRENIVVVECGDLRAGLVVDELQGEVQTVIKPLGRILQNLKGINGATILGSGNVAVIIDVPNLIQRAAFSIENTGAAADAMH